MKKEEARWFRQEMEKLRILLPTSIKLSEKDEAIRINEFWEVLKDYSAKQVFQGIELAKTEQFFFPTPAELINYVQRVEIEPEVPLIEAPDMEDLKRAAGKGGVGRDALDLILGKLDQKITREEFIEGMKALDEKYPEAGWEEMAKLYEEGKRLP